MGAARVSMEPDYLGELGGRLAMAFAAGWAACFALCSALGAFLWSILGKAKDESIAQLKATMAANELQCAERDNAQQTRILQLETMLWMHGPQALRSQIQAVVSEQHREMRRALESGAVAKVEKPHEAG